MHSIRLRQSMKQSKQTSVRSVNSRLSLVLLNVKLPISLSTARLFTNPANKVLLLFVRVYPKFMYLNN